MNNIKYQGVEKEEQKEKLEFSIKLWYKYIEWCSRNFRSLELFFYLMGDIMKEYKSNEKLINYLISKNMIVNDKEKALKL